MALTAGVLSQLSVGSNEAQVAATAATGGTGPYTQQWYRSTTTGFSPGAGNIIAGATSLTLNDSGLIPNTIYYYKVVYTDTGNSNATVTATQLVVTTTPQTISPNQFAQSEIAGVVDLRTNPNTQSAQIHSSQATPLYAGAAVKVVDEAGGVPKVVGITSAADDVWGFINYDIKTVAFQAGAPCEISQAGNAIYLYAQAPIARGAKVQANIISQGSVSPVVGSSGADLVGYADDKATAAGDLIRVIVKTPYFGKA